MRKRNSVIVSTIPEVATGFRGPDREDMYRHLLGLRKWCRENAKSPWRTYELRHGGGVIKYFIVFEFDSKKDEMLFRLKHEL